MMIITTCILIINLCLILLLVLFERREVTSIWGWILIMLFLPVVGLVLYLLFGKGIRSSKMFSLRELEKELYRVVKAQESLAERIALTQVSGKYRDLLYYNLYNPLSFFSQENDVDYYLSGEAKFQALYEDVQKAEKFVHIQYFILRNDGIFERIKEVLIQKASKGVQVRILYDALGCRSIPGKFWEELKEYGIQVAAFFPGIFKGISFRVNYRNHRKIVVIDNNVGYVGGFNVGKEYADNNERMGHWRDTHLRIQGTAVLALQLRFLLDYNFATGENCMANKELLVLGNRGKRDGCLIQIISSGPGGERAQIRDNYLRLIAGARKSIYIQTPYFIPDEAIRQALLLASRSGIEVNLMLPCKPDHPFVYWASLFYAGELILNGAKCYVYDNGFLHSKGVVVDSEVLCFGTANLDMRSFFLNFEVNAIIYNEDKAKEMESIIRCDMEKSTWITLEKYNKRPLGVRIKEQFSRLVSPIL